MRFVLLFAISAALFLLSSKTWLPRGIRNNNPGNIRHTSDRWRGMSEVQTDPDFVQFDSSVWGVRAMARILRNYERRGINTVREIINTYSPDGNEPAYTDFLAKQLDVSPDTVLELDNDLLPLIKAMITFENGALFESFFRDDTIRQGVALA